MCSNCRRALVCGKWDRNVDSICGAVLSEERERLARQKGQQRTERWVGAYEICGDNSGEDTPVPIPNTEVKLLSADDTWWETAWESRTLPLLLKKNKSNGLFFFSFKEACKKGQRKIGELTKIREYINFVNIWSHICWQSRQKSKKLTNLTTFWQINLHNTKIIANRCWQLSIKSDFLSTYRVKGALLLFYMWNRRDTGNHKRTWKYLKFALELSTKYSTTTWHRPCWHISKIWK